MRLLTFSTWCGLLATLSILYTLTAAAQDFVACSLRPPPPRYGTLEWSGHPEQLTGRPISSATLEQIFRETKDVFKSRSLAYARSVHIVASSIPNAYVRRRDAVYVTSELLNSVTNLDQLRYVLSHEHAHIALAHRDQPNATGEIAADSLALLVLGEHGISPCSGLSTLTLLRKRFPIYQHALASRLAALRSFIDKPCQVPD